MARRKSSLTEEKLRFNDDTEEPVFHVLPTDNVYSYFMFVGPTEQAKEGGTFTWDTIMSWILGGLNFLFQGLLLVTIFGEVVIANQEWQASIYRAHDQSFLAPAPSQCNAGGSMCFTENGNYTCAPPSVQLTGRWDELDTNGDGIWTREEVEASKEQLQCKYIVNPVEVFDVFVTFLKNREKILWLHPDVQAGRAIHKAYFNFAAGDIIMCGYRNTDMCSNVLKRGFFHAPLKYGTAPRVGTTIDSALKYCYELLKPGGTCERTLPSTYSVWKISSNDQCGSPDYSKFVYTNPGNGVIKSLLEVDYSSRKKFALSRTTVFMTYKIIIIGMWLLAMCFEFKDLIVVITWCIRFPDATEFGDDAVHKEEADDGEVLYTIQGVTKSHRFCVSIMTLFRLALTATLAFVGISFLMKQTGYIDLLMDAVTLVFIVEIANILYTQALRPQIREQTESLQPMLVNMFGIDALNRRPALVDMLWFFGVVIAAMIIVGTYTSDTVTPLYDALQCACLGLGDNCVEAKKFSYDFWYDYWKNTIPSVFDEIDTLKQSTTSLVELTSNNETLVLSSLKSSTRKFLLDVDGL